MVKRAKYFPAQRKFAVIYFSKFIMSEIIKKGSPEWVKIVFKIAEAGGTAAKNAALALCVWFEEQKSKPNSSSS